MFGLMFASHAFSADVTGTALGTYKSDKKHSNFYTKTDVYVSTSSRTDTGITFGADFNLNIEGNSSTDRTVYSGSSQVAWVLHLHLVKRKEVNYTR
ncbi:MAG: hypothetical protein ACPG8V_05080 [Alphaproteobacteria bacterium]